MLTTEIGKTAGEVWKCLAKNGKTSLTALSTKVKVNSKMVHQAIGWLARENKIHLDGNAENPDVWLTEQEKVKHKPTGDDDQAGCSART